MKNTKVVLTKSILNGPREVATFLWGKDHERDALIKSKQGKRVVISGMVARTWLGISKLTCASSKVRIRIGLEQQRDISGNPANFLRHLKILSKHDILYWDRYDHVIAVVILKCHPEFFDEWIAPKNTVLNSGKS